MMTEFAVPPNDFFPQVVIICRSSISTFDLSTHMSAHDQVTIVSSKSDSMALAKKKILRFFSIGNLLLCKLFFVV